MSFDETRITQKFSELYGQPSLVSARASGRVNLIGEHTDYNGGFVLPMGLPVATHIRLRPVAGSQVIEAASLGIENSLVRYELGSEAPTGEWDDYLKGVTKILRADGHSIGGAQLLIDSQVPMGSGLSSSAALEVALLRAFRTAFELPITDLAIAQLGQRVENEFVGAKVGIMDPMAASLAAPGSALFINTRTLDYEKIVLPTDLMDIVVINSGIAHRLAPDADGTVASYNQRRAECEAAADHLEIPLLSDYHPKLDARFAELAPVLQRRVRHIVTENARVLEAVESLKNRNIGRLGELFKLSHASMRDDYQISIPEIDRLVEIANEQPDVYGARLTGGGFGGSIVLLAHPGRGQQTAAKICQIYDQETGETSTVLATQ